VIVSPRIGRSHYVPLLVMIVALPTPLPDLGLTLGATFSFAWLAWYEPNAPSRLRNLIEVVAIWIPLGFGSWLVNATLGTGGGWAMFGAMMVLALLIWRVRARRTLARFNEQVEAGAKLSHFTLSTRGVRPGDIDRSA
jgi:hypothetical protein